MKVERIRPAVLQVTFSAYELASLIAAARWVVEGADGELAPEATQQLKQVLASYDAACAATRLEPRHERPESLPAS